MSSFNEKALIWMNGRLIPWKEAKIHVASHVVQFIMGHRFLKESEPIIQPRVPPFFASMIISKECMTHVKFIG